jgi:hypothetical protein
MFITLSGVLSSDVAVSGTVAVSLPTSTSGQTLSAFQANFPVTGGDFLNGFAHRLSLGAPNSQFGGGDALTHPHQFDLSLSASSVTLTNRSGFTWRAGTGYRLQLEMQGFRFYQDNDPNFSRKLVKAVDSPVMLMNLGMPAATSATSIAAAQAVASASNLTLNGANVVNGVAFLDVPRSLTIVSTNAGDTTQVATFFGLDQYGFALREAITFNGTTAVQGNKAFASISRVAISAALTGNATAGHGNKLGLPVHLPNAGFIIRELQDGGTATAGTTVAGIRTAGGSTSTTGDVRGTYVPNTAPTGSITYQLIAVIPDAGNLGMPQFNG